LKQEYRLDVDKTVEEEAKGKETACAEECQEEVEHLLASAEL
jgi:hypothetical protein